MAIVVPVMQEGIRMRKGWCNRCGVTIPDLNDCEDSVAFIGSMLDGTDDVIICKDCACEVMPDGLLGLFAASNDVREWAYAVGHAG